MKKHSTNTNASTWKGHGGSRLGWFFAALALTACGKSSPNVADITPPLMEELNQCELWTVSEVKKVDGIPGQNSYRADFSAKLTIKGTPEAALQKFNAHLMDPNWVGCHRFLGRLTMRYGALWKTYDVSGAGQFVKSEKGWRLLGELGQYDFVPTKGQAESESAIVRPLGYERQATATTLPAQKPVEPAPPEPALSSCAAAKMKAFDEGRSKEIDAMGKEARAKGEELQISAGPEELMRQEALDKANADCK